MKSNTENKLKEFIPGYVSLEKISESGPNLICRAIRKADGQAVVLKTLRDNYPRKEDIAGILREHQTLTMLQVEGVIRVFDLVSYGHGNLAIVMEAFGEPLDGYLQRLEKGSLSLREFFGMALQLTEIFGRIHEQRIIHKDVAPSNMLIDPDSGRLRVIDFSSSSSLAREHQQQNLTRRIEGSLPFMSPEQTGRMNRDIDYRTDYYSLGVTFFYLLTGQLPFKGADALEWIHCHISRIPPAPGQLNPNIPKALSGIVLKLMSKNAEDRYQSSYGLAADLKKCQEHLGKEPPDWTFPLGESDVSRQFQVPQKLYGRAQELEVLQMYFEKALDGTMEFCVVSGYSGVGKSVLVQELGRSIVQKNGYLIHGKFEQFKQNTSYFALALALRNLMRQILGEPADRLEQWKQKILGALGINAQLIVDFVPELELIIGEQPPVQELSPAETQNRLQLLFLNFIRVFAAREHPFVIFLDDLQWSDIPTLNLLSRLVASQDLSHLLIIGAYRDNAVDATHPLSITLSEIQEKRHVENLALKPLAIEAVDQLVRDALLCDEGRSGELSQVLFEKTGGNPFFTIELLKDLSEQGVIRFDPKAGRWDWDIEAVRKVEHSDNVIEFLVAGQHRLPQETQTVLQLAACIGAEFDLRTLAVIHEAPMEQVASDLLGALKTNMIIPLDDTYRYVGIDQGGRLNAAGGPEGGTPDTLNPTYQFQHDRVQQAAYSLIPEEKRKALHLSIGRLMLSHSSPAELEDKLLEVVGHLNAGRTLVDDPEEQIKIARLNLAAGTKARQSSAYGAALKYLKVAHHLLGQGMWQEDYQLAWDLSREMQNCFYLTGAWEEADAWTEVLLEESRSDLEKGIILSARTRQYATTGRMGESIEAAYRGFSILGFPFSEAPDASDVQAETSLLARSLEGREIADLIDLPEMQDPKARIVSELLMEIFPAAFLSGSGQMFPYLVLKSVNVALQYGNSPETAFAYAAHGMLLCGYFEDPAQGYSFGKLGVDLIEKFGDIALKSRIIYVYTMFVHHWSHHWASMTPWFRKGIEAGYQSGDLLYLAYSAQDCIIWDPGLDLAAASEEQRKFLAIVAECEYQDSLDSGTLFLQMQLNFQGLTESTYSLTDKAFNEEACVRGMQQRQFMTGIANYHIYKGEIHLLYNDPQGGLQHVKAMEALVPSAMSLPQLVRLRMVSFLVRSALLPEAGGAGREEMDGKMQEHLGKMAAWAAHCPENFGHLHLLMEAEMERHQGHFQEAFLKYQQSAELAGRHGYRRDEAMANELTAKFLLENGMHRAAEGFLKAAHYLYYRWGAHRKVKELEDRYAVVKDSHRYTGKSDGQGLIDQTGTISTESFNSELLDVSSVLKASQTISGELVLQNLLKATLQILMENAGAQRGFLVEQREGDLMVHARGDTDSGAAEEPPGRMVAGRMELPVSLINTALRTNSPIVIDDASEVNPFSSDAYIQEARPLSVMCVPIPIRDEQKIAVYLENNITHSVFSEQRVRIIKLLSGQAAISIENARIYEAQERLLKAQQRFVPRQFLKHLGHNDIAKVQLGESVGMEMSVLFSDIRDFTPLVEVMSPEQIITTLNRYFSRLGEAISECGGFIDSYAGDEIMALFSVPAQKAVEAGVKMSEAMREFNRESASRGEPAFKMGIGINTGPLVLGTMGGQQRMQCSVLGDTVNLAARIEQLNKVYGSQLLISEQTLRHLDDPGAFSIRMVDYVAVKGKDNAVKLYEVLDAENEARRRAKEATRADLEEAMQAYFSRDFDRSLERIRGALEKDPLDPILNLFSERCHKYLKTPPPEDWKGFERLSSK